MRKSPFRPTFTRLVTQAVPAGRENCRRFAHALATRNARLMADGGWLLPLGSEEAMRRLCAGVSRAAADCVRRD